MPRLSLDAVRELAEPHGADAGAIHRLTQGNAFYVTEILAAGGGALPETVRDAVLARAAILEPRGATAPRGRLRRPARAELWLLEAVAPTMLEQLDACLASGVLRADGDGVAFRHELARLAVESAVAAAPAAGARTRRSFALSTTRGRRSRGSPTTPRRPATPPPCSSTHRTPREQAAAARAHREAAAQYARALRHAGTLPTAERAAVLAGYAQEAQRDRQYIESIDAPARGDRALPRARRHDCDEGERAGPPDDHVHRRSAAMPRRRTASRDAIELLERAAARAGARERLRRRRPTLRMLNRDNADGVVWGEQAAGGGRALGDDEMLAFGAEHDRHLAR